jgi:hypothetical protein
MGLYSTALACERAEADFTEALARVWGARACEMRYATFSQMGRECAALLVIKSAADAERSRVYYAHIDAVGGRV